MIQVTVFYPYTEGARFDWAYYATQHMPMVADKLGSALKGWTVVHGLNGGKPGVPPAFVAMAHMLFESAETFAASFGPHGKTFAADMPNYTEIAPRSQVSELLGQG